eukprot:COSAG05_NODE_1202_length_5536_cov_1.814420_1_plen_92_part_10
MPARQVKVLLLGFGNVGQAFASMLLSSAAELADAGLEIRVVGISTRSHGCTCAWGGVDLHACLAGAFSELEGQRWRLPDGDVRVASSEAMLA